MIKVKLEKLSSNANAMRTDIVEGECNALPFPGQRFVVYSEALDFPYGVRYIRTSEVKELLPDGRFVTANSEYRVTQL